MKDLAVPSTSRLGKAPESELTRPDNGRTVSLGSRPRRRRSLSWPGTTTANREPGARGQEGPTGPLHLPIRLYRRKPPRQQRTDQPGEPSPASDYARQQKLCRFLRRRPRSIFIGPGGLGPRTDAKMVVALRTKGDPANIPHDVENRRVATGIDQESTQQISGPFRLPP
jgi:hypothetical protein